MTAPAIPSQPDGDVQPNGQVVLVLLGRPRTVTGGPFDACPDTPDLVAVCLEPRSRRAGRADILVEVADFHAPPAAVLTRALVDCLHALARHPDRPVFVGCRAGIGRTGLFIAALAKLAGMDDPVGWTRAHYLAAAVETPAQEAAVNTLDAAAVWDRFQQESGARP